MSKALGEAAEKAPYIASITSEPGMCSRAVRQTTRIPYGQKFEHLFGGSAKETEQNFKDAGLSIEPEHGSVVGDILFKEPSDANGHFGHVGIRVAGNRVFDNSTSSVGRIHGAKGFKTLKQFGTVSSIGRLPEPPKRRK